MNRKTGIFLILIFVLTALSACSSSSQDSGENKPGLSEPQKTELVTSQPYQWGQRTKTTGCKNQNELPDAACTPGDIEKVSKEQLCGESAPADAAIPDDLKAQVFEAYNLSTDVQKKYQLDILVPPSLGGKVDIANVWPQALESSPGVKGKDEAEQYLHEQVCAGAISLEEAQISIANDWRDVYTHMDK